MLLEIIDEARGANATTKAIRQIFASDYLTTNYPNKLKQRKDSPRISNMGDVSTSDFINIIKNTVKGVKDVKILPPNQSPNPSSKFNAFEFESADGKALIVLAGKGAEQSERQERALIQAINTKGVTKVKFNNRTITGIQSAEKIGRVKGYSHEPYADILLKTDDGDVRISAKAFRAPSFGGGGLSGMDELNIPDFNDFVEKSYEEAYDNYKAIIEANEGLEEQNLQGDSRFKDYYTPIDSNVLVELLTGNEKIGGPVDYYYTGDMDVEATVEGDTAIIKGGLYTVDEFIKSKGTFSLRIGKREGSCYFTDDYNNLNNITTRKLFTKQPNGKGGTQSRAFVVVASQKSKST